MAGFRMSKFGDWTKAGIILQQIPKNIEPLFSAKLLEDGEMIRQRLVDHIDSQDLSWKPLSPATISKKGHSTIYVETGYLKEHLLVRRVKAPKGGITLFIGASPWTSTDDGLKLSDLMIFMEYGTQDTPARPLIRPTWNEVESIIKSHYNDIVKDLIRTGGRVK